MKRSTANIGCITIALTILLGCARNTPQTGSQAPKSTSTPEQRTQAATEIAPEQKTTLRVQYPGLDSVEAQDFRWSFAFMDDGGYYVYLVFRNYESPAQRFKSEPTEGHAELLIILQRFLGGPREKPTAGDYKPGLYPVAVVNPKGSFLLQNKAGNPIGVNGCYWTAKSKAKTETGLLDGTVTITELGSKLKSFIKGSLKLEHGSLTATGDFCIPIIETPTDY